MGLIAPILLLSAVVAILWSIGRGVGLLYHTYAYSTHHKQAKRILAWNLIEPGITVPNVLVWLVVAKDIATYPTEFFLSHFNNDPSTFFLGLSLCFWPMLVVFVLIPLLYQRSPDPLVRRAAKLSGLLGSARFLITLITYCFLGIGMLVGVPLLFWSIKRIWIWSAELDGEYPTSSTFGIGKGPLGMRVVPTTVSSVTVLLSPKDSER